MSMPKGAKIKGGYATISDDPEAMNFRTISEIMTDAGYKMNHASVRNHLLRAMRKFAETFASYYGKPMSSDELDDLARNPAFQDCIRTLVQNQDAFDSNKERKA